ncbi:unnamed protein product [Cylicocyclus nassatus]|uniref:Uncharacterized protein n=1 Tax=Cylicocyclus nassatus TaxID=53992 RepID=A0AA36DJS8_CYLNA|nr:unnamed protein product [Cylicocyclus nassatus]
MERFLDFEDMLIHMILAICIAGAVGRAGTPRSKDSTAADILADQVPDLSILPEERQRVLGAPAAFGIGIGLGTMLFGAGVAGLGYGAYKVAQFVYEKYKAARTFLEENLPIIG